MLQFNKCATKVHQDRPYNCLGAILYSSRIVKNEGYNGRLKSISNR